MTTQRTGIFASEGRASLWAGFLHGLALAMVGLVLVALGFVGGTAAMWTRGTEIRQRVTAALPQLAPSDAQMAREERMRLLWEVWGILDREYLDPKALNDQKMVYGAVAGLVDAVGDPHTAFAEPVRAALMDSQLQGSFDGIGATVDMVDGRVVIVRPLPGGPATKAGLQAGDVVLEVDGRGLEGMTLAEAISLIRGPRDTVARLLVQRKDTPEPFVISIMRGKVEYPTVEARMLDGNVAYLRLTEFNAVALSKMRPALADLLRSNPAGLVFDLRGNPGGYLGMAVEVAGQFLPRDTLILTEQQRDKPLEEHRVRVAGRAQDVPLVVLVNSGSASASEILAGAVRDHQRGVLIGQKTFGKGSVQSMHSLDGGASMHVTIAKWMPPSGVSLDGVGLKPDIEVSMTRDDVLAGKDPQLDRAVAYLLGSKGQ